MPKTARKRTVVNKSEGKICFWPGDALKHFDELNAFMKQTKKGAKFTKSFVFREGAKLYIKQMIEKVKKALNGNLHAKKRESPLLAFDVACYGAKVGKWKRRV